MRDTAKSVFLFLFGENIRIPIPNPVYRDSTHKTLNLTPTPIHTHTYTHTHTYSQTHLIKLLTHLQTNINQLFREFIQQYLVKQE